MCEGVHAAVTSRLSSQSLSLFVSFLSPEMATEPAMCTNATPAAESIVPACMFAPERGCEEEPCGAEGLDDCDGTNGEAAEHVDLSSKVGLHPCSSAPLQLCTPAPLQLHALTPG